MEARDLSWSSRRAEQTMAVTGIRETTRRVRIRWSMGGMGVG